MKNLIKYLNSNASELNVPNSLLPDVSEVSLATDPATLYIVACKLEKIAEGLKKHSRDNIIEEIVLSGNTTVNFDGVDVTLARVPNYDYPLDTFIETWTNTLEAQNKKIKELKEAISNRQKMLVDQGLAVELEPSFRITVK
jgi:L-ribulose-5-phosphate 3-epimerase UlaE